MNTSNLSPTVALPSDIPTLVRLRHAMFREMASSGSAAHPNVVSDDSWYPAAESMFADQMHSGALRAFIVRAPQAKGVIGSAVAQLVSRLPGPGFPSGLSGYLSSVYVESECRHHGVGRGMTVAALGWLEESGAEVIDLYATPASKKMYESLEFRSPASTPLRRLTVR